MYNVRNWSVLGNYLLRKCEAVFCHVSWTLCIEKPVKSTCIWTYQPFLGSLPLMLFIVDIFGKLVILPLSLYILQGNQYCFYYITKIMLKNDWKVNFCLASLVHILYMSVGSQCVALCMQLIWRYTCRTCTVPKCSMVISGISWNASVCLCECTHMDTR